MNSKKKNKFSKANDPLVSIIMPVYNGEKFVGEAIESVLNQTYENWELLIVDDGSTDNSKNVIAQYLSDGRIKYIRHKENKGIPGARNTGIENSNGEYIALLDHDDLWMPNKLKDQLSKFQNAGSKLGLVFGNIKVMNSKGKLIRKGNSTPKLSSDRMSNLKKLFIRNFIPSITVMFRRECLQKVGNFDESVTWGGDDYDLWLRIVVKFDIGYINKMLAIRREHAENYSDAERMVQGGIDLTEEMAKKYPVLEPLKDKSIALYLYQLGRNKHLGSEFKEARELYLKSLSYSPTVSWKPYIAYLLALWKVRFGRGR